MPDQKKSKDITPQEDAVAVIEDIESLDELEAFVEGDERKGVDEAVEVRVEQLTTDEPTTDDGETADDETAEVAVLAVPVADLEPVFEAVEVRVEEERNNRTGQAKGVDKKLEEAHAALHKIIETADGKEIEIEEPHLAGIFAKIAEKVAMDQERRGMMQPSENDRALGKAKETLSGFNE